MKKVVAIKNGSFLTPNKEHKNFTDSGKNFRVGALMEGEFKNIQGKRRGEDFTYRLFFTNKGGVVYADCVTPLTATMEVISSAVGKNTEAKAIPTPPPTNVKEISTKSGNTGLIALGIGSVLGYIYSKGKNLSKEYTIIYTVGAGIILYGIHKTFTKKS
jgi:hypothetical protein